MERNKNSSYIQKKKEIWDRCENYRGIALENTAYRILGNIILEKIKPYIEKITGDYQKGFRDGRSVINNKFVWKIINKKIWEYNQIVEYFFIDFQQAYDSIHKDTQWKFMEEFKIPKKLINMYKTCVQNTRSAVRIEGKVILFLKIKQDWNRRILYHKYYWT